MTDQRSLDAAWKEINRLRAGTFHDAAKVGRYLDQIMSKSGMDLPAIFSRFASDGTPLGISPVMAELVVRLYRKAPTWADDLDQIQLPASADMEDLLELVETQQLDDALASLGVHLDGDEDEEGDQGQ